MDTWPGLADERRAIADLLESLTPEQWRVRTLCSAWDVHEMAAHLTVPCTFTQAEVVSTLVQARGSTARFGLLMTERRFGRSQAELIGVLRERAEVRRAPPIVGRLGPYTDTLIHHQDILIPLGMRDRRSPERWRPSLDFLVSARARIGFVPAQAARRTAGRDRHRLGARHRSRSGGASRGASAGADPSTAAPRRTERAGRRGAAGVGQGLAPSRGAGCREWTVSIVVALIIALGLLVFAVIGVTFFLSARGRPTQPGWRGPVPSIREPAGIWHAEVLGSGLLGRLGGTLGSTFGELRLDQGVLSFVPDGQTTAAWSHPCPSCGRPRTASWRSTAPT